MQFRERVNHLYVSEISVLGKPLCLRIAFHHLITAPLRVSRHERVLTKEVCFFFRRSLPANGQPTLHDRANKNLSVPYSFEDRNL